MKIVKPREIFNKEKVYSRLIVLCWLTIFLCFILKLFGSKEFEMPNYAYNISDTIQKIVNYIFYIANSIMFSLVLIKRKLNFKEILIVIGLSTPLFVISLFPKLLFVKFILEFVVYFLIGKIILKDKWYKILIESVLILLIFSVYQLISMSYKNINIKINIDNFVVSKLMSIDYYIMMILTYLYASKKGGYIYGQWFRFLVILSKRKRIKKSIQQVPSNLQKESVGNDNGFKLFTLMVAVFQFMLVFTLCYFINKTTWQFVIIFVSFCVMRAVFGKSYHCNTIIGCTTLSCFVFLIATKLSISSYITILCNVLIGLLVAFMMFVMYHYSKYTNAQGITLSRGMDKESLLAMCENLQLNDMEQRIMVDFYVNKKSNLQIAMALGYSEDNIKKIKAKIIKRISD